MRHLASHSEADAADLVVAALRSLDGRIVSLALPSPHPALPTLLRSGFVVTDFDIYMSSLAPSVSPAHVLSSGLA